MQRSDFHYTLPEELIAHRPPERRGDSRLLCLDGATGAVADHRFPDLERLLRPGDLLVLNNTRVIPARLHATKDTGGAVEILVERVLDASAALVHLRVSRAPRAGAVLHLEGGGRARVEGREGDCFRIRLEGDAGVEAYLEAHGHMPLPPYIPRSDDADDRDRYQTVFASDPGAVAAPTAGLHFEADALERLRAAGVEQAEITLHVGAGTFEPVRTDALDAHRMHSERFRVPQACCRAVADCRARGGRVVAVGTTVVRALESAAGDHGIEPLDGETAIFIRPGYRFRAVDALLTNFHLPESSLIMLVSAFAGHAHTMAAYHHAVAQRYRFFSYGDAMFIAPPHPLARAEARP